MKTILYILTALIVITGCTDLDNPPRTVILNDDFWEQEPAIEQFSFKLYAGFKGFGPNSFSSGEHYAGDILNDDVANKDLPSFTKRVPTSSSLWSFSSIRSANILISEITKTRFSEEFKIKYLALGRFFRAFYYWDKVKAYGDVPFYDQPLNPDDTELLFKKRDSRSFVMDKIIEDLDFATANLSEDVNRLEVTKWTVLAFKARICLFEGTYLKYHDIDQERAIQMLKEARKATLEIIESDKFELHDKYDELFNSEDLNPNKEIILHKKYDGTYLHAIPSFVHNDPQVGLTKSAVDAFLMADGKPISYDGTQHPNYAGDSTFFVDTALTKFDYVDVNYRLHKGRDSRLFNILDTNRVFIKGTVGLATPTGYTVSKYIEYGKAPPSHGVTSSTDAPIFRYGEVLLNYAEATYELGLITQADLDKSINLLRARAKVAMLTMNVGFDADDRDSDVDPLLWEIRRERRVELMLEGFRKNDIFRWKKGEKYYSLTDNPNAFVGIKIDTTGSGADVFMNENGYIYSWIDSKTKQPQGITFNPRNYLEPIPSDEITLNNKLTQNSGW